MVNVSSLRSILAISGSRPPKCSNRVPEVSLAISGHGRGFTEEAKAQNKLCPKAFFDVMLLMCIFNEVDTEHPTCVSLHRNGIS